MTPADVLGPRPRLLLPQHVDDLLLREPRPLHDVRSPDSQSYSGGPPFNRGRLRGAGHRRVAIERAVLTGAARDGVRHPAVGELKEERRKASSTQPSRLTRRSVDAMLVARAMEALMRWHYSICNKSL